MARQRAVVAGFAFGASLLARAFCETSRPRLPAQRSRAAVSLPLHIAAYSAHIWEKTLGRFIFFSFDVYTLFLL